MNEDEVRERLGAAVPHADWCHEADRHPEFPCACQGDRTFVAESLFPVVRAVACEARLPFLTVIESLREEIHASVQLLTEEYVMGMDEALCRLRVAAEVDW